MDARPADDRIRCPRRSRVARPRTPRPPSQGSSVTRPTALRKKTTAQLDRLREASLTARPMEAKKKAEASIRSAPRRRPGSWDIDLLVDYGEGTPNAFISTELKGQGEMPKAKELKAGGRKELLEALKSRFEQNRKRHEGIDWAKVQARLEAAGEKLG